LLQNPSQRASQQTFAICTLLVVCLEERHTSIGFSTQWNRSAMGVTRVSWGRLLNVPFFAVILFFWDPEASAPDDESERSLLVKMLEVLLRDSWRNAISSPFWVPPLLIDLLVEIHVGVLICWEGSLAKPHHLWTKKRSSLSRRCICRKSHIGHRICDDVTYGTCSGAATWGVSQRQHFFPWNSTEAKFRKVAWATLVEPSWVLLHWESCKDSTSRPRNFKDVEFPLLSKGHPSGAIDW
jgi:hypothetical protein